MSKYLRSLNLNEWLKQFAQTKSLSNKEKEKEYNQLRDNIIYIVKNNCAEIGKKLDELTIFDVKKILNDFFNNHKADHEKSEVWKIICDEVGWKYVDVPNI